MTEKLLKQFELKENERLDDLEYNDLHIIQDKNVPGFTSDAVLLANLAGSGKKSCDIGTGSGIIAILMAGKGKTSHIDAIEIQTELSDRALRSVYGNKLEDKVFVHNINALEAPEILVKDSYDLVVSNPPYYKVGTGELREDLSSAQARHELTMTFEGLSDVASQLLKYGGKFCFIHKIERMAEIIFTLKSKKLEPKKIILINPTFLSQPDTFICICKKGAKEGVLVENLYVFDEENNMTEQAKMLYNKL